MVRTVSTLCKPPLESVQGAFPRQSVASIARSAPALARRVALTDTCRQQGIPTQILVIIEILVPEGEPKDSLSQQVFDRVLDPLRETLDQTELLIDLSQQQRATVRADPTPIKRRHHFASAWPLK